MNKIGFKIFLASIGLLLLGLSAGQMPENTDIGSIEASDIGEKVTVEGNITSAYSTDSASFIELKDSTGKISAVSFSGKGFSASSALLVGRIDMYEGELQIVIDQASVLP